MNLLEVDLDIENKDLWISPSFVLDISQLSLHKSCILQTTLT